jgi:soluble lytic murein transglycosylase-like protein
LLTTFENDERLAIAVYNAGPGRVLYYGNVPRFIETYTLAYKFLGLRILYADAYPATQDQTGKSMALLEASIST